MRWPASPTVDLLVVFGVVYLTQVVGGIFGIGVSWFALAMPMAHPWTLVTTVYAHANVSHLLTNAVALTLVGLALERLTTRIRFHGFVLVTGMFAASAEFLVGLLVGTPGAVLGASGAILALYGYVLAGDPITGGVLALVDLDRRTMIVFVAAIAIIVTLITAGPGVALVAHGTGFTLGLISGRLRLLKSR